MSAKADETTQPLVSPSGTPHLVFQNVTVTVGDKTLLTNLSGQAKSGEIMAVMGPSGSGKTTLISALSHTLQGPTLEGEVLFRGHKLTSKIFTNHCGLVTQHDNLWETLTPRQILRYTAELIGREDPEKAVESIIASLGLTSCADTKVGNPLFKSGLSGGQKKRLSVANLMLKLPEVIILDEPTSGLDAAAAFHTVEFLKQTAIEHNIAIICSIHQPSAEVFDMIDNVMLLSNGKLCYSGPREEITPYFTSKGCVSQHQESVADFILKVVNSDFSDPEKVEELVQAWANEHVPPPMPKDPNPLKETVKQVPQLMIMLRRQTTIIMSDPIIYFGRMIMFLFTNIFFSIIYCNVRIRDQDQILNRMWLGIWSIGPTSNMGLVAIYYYGQELTKIKAEVANGIVRPGPYLLTSTLWQIPGMLGLGLFALIPPYAINDYQGAGFLSMLVLFSATYFVFETIGQLQTVAVPNLIMGMLNFLNFWFTAFLFSGLFLPESDVPWPFRVFNFVTPFTYMFPAMTEIEFTGTTFDGARDCDDTIRNDCLGKSSEGGHFRCVNRPAMECYGKEGDQILYSVSQVFDGVVNELTIWENIAVVLAIGAAIKIFYVAMFYMKINSMFTKDHEAKPKAEPAAPPTSALDVASNVKNEDL